MAEWNDGGSTECPICTELPSLTEELVVLEVAGQRFEQSELVMVLWFGSLSVQSVAWSEDAWKCWRQIQMGLWIASLADQPWRVCPLRLGHWGTWQDWRHTASVWHKDTWTQVGNRLAVFIIDNAFFTQRWEGLAQDGRREKYGSLIDGPARFPTAKQGEVEGEEWSPLVHRHCDPSVTFAWSWNGCKTLNSSEIFQKCL